MGSAASRASSVGESRNNMCRASAATGCTSRRAFSSDRTGLGDSLTMVPAALFAQYTLVASTPDA